ncbi:MAG: hypothetical protein R3B09_20330 [Nannocystaceae bacterium]
MDENTLQVRINRVVLDRPYLKQHGAYALTIAERRGVDPDVQFYLSPQPFQVSRDGLVWTPDVAREFSGQGLMIFSTPLEGFDHVSVSTYLFHDREEMRGVSEHLTTLLRKSKLDDSVAGAVASAVAGGLGAGGGVASAAVRMIPEASVLLTGILSQIPDRVLISAEGVVTDQGTLRIAKRGHVPWGRRDHNDHGYFDLTWEAVHTHEPRSVVRTVDLPPEVVAKLRERRRG